MRYMCRYKGERMPTACHFFMRTLVQNLYEAAQKRYLSDLVDQANCSYPLYARISLFFSLAASVRTAGKRVGR